MVTPQQILELALQDPIRASELASQLIDPFVGLSKELITKYGSEIGDQIKAINSFMTDLDIRNMDQYLESGFSREEALQLMTVRKQTSAKALNANRK